MSACKHCVWRASGYDAPECDCDRLPANCPAELSSRTGERCMLTAGHEGPHHDSVTSVWWADRDLKPVNAYEQWRLRGESSERAAISKRGTMSHAMSAEEERLAIVEFLRGEKGGFVNRSEIPDDVLCKVAAKLADAIEHGVHMAPEHEPCAECGSQDCSGAPRFKGICPQGIKWMHPSQRGWGRVWAILHERRGSDPGWQYMGTDGREHVFRLREGDPRYERIIAEPGDFSTEA